MINHKKEKRKVDVHKTRCPECLKEIGGISSKQAQAMIGEHRKGNYHKNVVEALKRMVSLGAIKIKDKHMRKALRS